MLKTFLFCKQIECTNKVAKALLSSDCCLEQGFGEWDLFSSAFGKGRVGAPSFFSYVPFYHLYLKTKADISSETVYIYFST
jgi:hypothetical protein